MLEKNAWSYPISRKENYDKYKKNNDDKGYFTCKNEEKIDATSENFISYIKKKELKTQCYWCVNQLYNDIEIGDILIIYEVKYGIIGYANIVGKNDTYKELAIELDEDKSSRLIDLNMSVESYIKNKPARDKTVLRLDNKILEDLTKIFSGKIDPDDSIPW